MEPKLLDHGSVQMKEAQYWDQIKAIIRQLPRIKLLRYLNFGFSHVDFLTTTSKVQK
jgi:hypothetical protein